MYKNHHLSRYEAPEAETLLIEVRSGILQGSDSAEVDVVVPKVEDSGYSYDF